MIDPGRAFGTGAHATTRLCLELLLDARARAACSTSAAARACSRSRRRSSASRPVVAVDDDPLAVEATRANAVGERRRRSTARLADALDEPLPAGRDVAVANIALGAVEAARRRASTCERLVASGYLESDQPALPGYARGPSGATLEGWAADAVRRPSE